jgi:hypothetical protein
MGGVGSYSGMAERPTGTVTFLFTDVEGSTRLWEEHPAGTLAALEPHDLILRSAIEVMVGMCFRLRGMPSLPRSLALEMRLMQR